jgi:hypothetical protein
MWPMSRPLPTEKLLAKHPAQLPRGMNGGRKSEGNPHRDRVIIGDVLQSEGTYLADRSEAALTLGV